MLTFFRGRGRRRGAHPVLLPSYVGSPTLTANTTTTIGLAGPHRKSFIDRLSVSVGTVPADSDGTITFVVQKWDASADAAVALTAATDAETLTAYESANVALLTSLTDAQRTFDEGDTLRVVFTNNSAAINTQPAGLVLTGEFLVLE